MNRVAQTVVACVLMFSSGAFAILLRPTDSLAQKRSVKVDLEKQIPESFGDWKLDPMGTVAVVNPEAQEMLDRIYTQLLTRDYVNSRGDRVMFVVAYGADQRRRSGLNLHQPEICYPAQGFEIRSNRISSLAVGGITLRIKRLETVFESRRYEPVTYWTMTGEYPNVGGFAKRNIDFRYGLQRTIPDGMLVRVSTIGSDTARQFDIQSKFIEDLISHLPPDTRKELVGEGPPAAAG